MIDDVKNALGLDWKKIQVLTVEGVEMYKALDVCKQLSISNTTIATDKVDKSHKRKFVTGEIEIDGEPFDVRPWYVDEAGLLQLIIQNHTPATSAIRDRIALEVLPRILEIVEDG